MLTRLFAGERTREPTHYDHQEEFLCADLSRQNQEQLYGRRPAQTLMPLEYPRTWGAKALKESDLPETVKAYLSSFLKRTPPVRFSFIKQTRTP
ncbi:MAG: hypothetical protein WKF84_24810 [Pyrinomonadaceae bacterium]